MIVLIQALFEIFFGRWGWQGINVFKVLVVVDVVDDVIDVVTVVGVGGDVIAVAAFIVVIENVNYFFVYVLCTSNCNKKDDCQFD